MKEVITVIVLWAILAVALVAPLLVVAIALGPVVLGIVCALGFGFGVFALVNLVIGLGVFGRSVERAAVRHARHPTATGGKR